jgi:hypothetical protein
MTYSQFYQNVLDNENPIFGDFLGIMSSEIPFEEKEEVFEDLCYNLSHLGLLEDIEDLIGRYPNFEVNWAEIAKGAALEYNIKEND